MSGPVSTADIARRIAAINAKLTSLGFEADAFSYAAVSGDTAAADALQDVRQQQLVLNDELTTLEAAKAQAERLETAEFEELKAAVLEQHRQNARRIVVEMGKLAKSIDKQRNSLDFDVGAMRDLEKSLRAPAYALDEGDTGRTGQHQITQIAIAYIGSVGATGPDAEPWSASRAVDVAWNHILDLKAE